MLRLPVLFVVVAVCCASATEMMRVTLRNGEQHVVNATEVKEQLRLYAATGKHPVPRPGVLPMSDADIQRAHQIPELYVAATQIGCGSNTDCSSCVDSSWGCDWCMYTKECDSKWNPVSKCAPPGVDVPTGAGGWIKDTSGCNTNIPPLTGDWSGTGKNISGCTDPNALNFRFRATVAGERCHFSGEAPNKFPTTYCVCSDAGYSTPYGRFTGTGYTGADGQQPCDEADKCAQMHDWCVGVLGYSACNCTMFLYECVDAAKPLGGGFCGKMQDMISTLQTELGPVYAGCKELHPDMTPYCDAAVNCNGRGSCSWTGECRCNPGFSGYACEYERE